MRKKLIFFSSVFTDKTNTQAPVTYDIFSSTSITNIETDEQIILNKLNKLDVSKSPGPDGLHSCILYELQNEIAFPLKILYQTSFKLTTLPLDWTSGYIVAIHKKGNKNDPLNYRPVCLTSVVCKIFESIIRDNLMEQSHGALHNQRTIK